MREIFAGSFWSLYDILGGCFGLASNGAVGRNGDGLCSKCEPCPKPTRLTRSNRRDLRERTLSPIRLSHLSTAKPVIVQHDRNFQVSCILILPTRRFCPLHHMISRVTDLDLPSSGAAADIPEMQEPPCVKNHATARRDKVGTAESYMYIHIPDRLNRTPQVEPRARISPPRRTARLPRPLSQRQPTGGLRSENLGARKGDVATQISERQI